MHYHKTNSSMSFELPLVKAADGQLKAVILNEPAAYLAFSKATSISAQPGVYIVTNANGQNCVGHGGDLRQRISQHTFGVMQPTRIVAIVGQTKPLDREEAAALERVIAQALWPSRDLDLNQHYPHGGRITDDQYSRLQAGWASLAVAFRTSMLELAKPWTGPEYGHVPAPDENTLPGGRRIARRRGLRASIMPASSGYVIEKGSLVRAEPRDQKRRLSWAMRSECRFAGILVSQGDALKLTRPLHFATIAACSRFVFDTTETAIWQSPDDFIDFPAG